MPLTVNEIFNKCELFSYEHVKWGSRIPQQYQGVYIISTSDDPNNNFGISRNINFNNHILTEWIERLPSFKLDGSRPTLELLSQRLNSFWHPDENILYIGKADIRKNGLGLGERIDEYYSSRLGYKSAHSGGQWLKAIEQISELHIYYAKTIMLPTSVEIKMLQHFNNTLLLNNINNSSELMLPFANLELLKGQRKKHGLKKQRA